MAILFSDDFSGTGVLEGNAPDTGFDSLLWEYNPVDDDGLTQSGGYVSAVLSLGKCTYGPAVTSLPSVVSAEFVFRQTATPTLGNDGFDVTLTVGSKNIRLALYHSAGLWHLIFEDAGVEGYHTADEGDANLPTSIVTLSTDHTILINVNTTAGQIEAIAFGHTYSITRTASGGLTDIAVGTGNDSRLGGITISDSYSSLPVETISISGSMPSPQVAFQGEGRIVGAMPSAQVAMTLNESVPNVVTAQMPFPTVAMQGGAKVAGAMPMPLASAAITTVGLIDIATVMPMPQVSTEVTKTESVSVAAAMPMAQVIGYGGALISATISGFTSRATITSGSTFNIAATLPLFEVSMQVTKGETISIEALMPMLTKGPFGRITAVMPMAQVSLIGHAVVAVTYEAYAVNLIHKGVKEPVDEVTRYTNFPFERIVRYNNSYFGVAADGLYLLEGTTDHATPATTIPWEFKTHLTDFENPKEKTVVSAYFGGRMGKAETITLYAGEKTTKAYKYKTARGSTAQNHREKFGRGIKARYFAVGADGADVMELDNIEFNIHSLTRRI